MKPRKKQSAIVFVLKGLMPYTRENLMLSFNPNRFFNELEKTSNYNKYTLQRAYNRGVERGLINKKDKALTEKGLRAIQPFVADKLDKGARLMVAFDIPEDSIGSRRRFRRILKAWRFKQEQKSVWSTDMDFRNGLVEVIIELGLKDCVEIYEYVRLFPKKKG